MLFLRREEELTKQSASDSRREGQLHNMRTIVDDVKELCTRMAIINEGELLLEGNPMDALTSIEGKIWNAGEHIIFLF